MMVAGVTLTPTSKKTGKIQLVLKGLDNGKSTKRSLKRCLWCSFLSRSVIYQFDKQSVGMSDNAKIIWRTRKGAFFMGRGKLSVYKIKHRKN